MHLVIAAGGTGGHIFPALAIAEALARSTDVSITFIGVGKDLEKKIIPGAGYPLEIIPFVPITGKGPLGALKALLQFPVALRKALKLYQQQRPDVVLGCGGFPSAIPVIAAAIKHIPVVIQEQNVQVGLANKFLSLFASHIFAVPGAKGFWGKHLRKSLKITALSNPVRKKLYEVPEWQAPVDGQAFVLFVMGGSQGAVRLSSAVLELIDFFQANNISVVHQTGGADCARVQGLYAEHGFTAVEVQPFIADICREYSRAHLVISRAGAMSVAELQATGRPAIFVPLAIARAHQRENVEQLVEADSAIVVDQDDHLAKNLRTALQGLLSNPARLMEMAKKMRLSARSGKLTAAETIANELIAMGNNPS